MGNTIEIVGGVHELHCSTHGERQGSYICDRCGNVMCMWCIEEGGRGVVCAECNCSARPIRTELLPSKPEFFEALGEAFMYPLRGNAVLLTLMGGAFIGMASYAAIAPSVLGMFGVVILNGYFVAYLQKIIKSSASGKEKMPTWPSLLCIYADAVIPFFKVLFLCVLCAIPAVIYMLLMPDPSVLGLFLMIGVGLVIWPMGLLAVAILDTNSAYDPVFLLRSIWRVRVPYAVATVLMWILLFARYGIQQHLLRNEFWMYGLVIDGLVSMYFMTVICRMLGLIYYTQEDKLGWF